MDLVAPIRSLPAARPLDATEGAQSIGRALWLMRLVANHGEEGVSLSELVSETGLAKPTIRRILLALIDADMVEQDSLSRRYALGAQTYALGVMAARRHGLQRLALDNLIRLAEATGDTAFLVVRRGLHTLCLHREEGHFPIRTHVLKVGDRHPLGAGAAGLAILAAMPGPEIERIVEANTPLYEQRYPGLTPTILRDRLALTRHKGWALNPGLIFSGSWGLAVAIRNIAGDPVAALTIACIESRLQAERQEIIGPLLQAEAEKLETAMAQSAPAKELTARARNHALRSTASVDREGD